MIEGDMVPLISDELHHILLLYPFLSLHCHER